MGAPIPIADFDESQENMSGDARYQARQLLMDWTKDQIAVRDAEIHWMARRRELLIHEKIKIRKWTARAYTKCMEILRKHDGANIIAVTPDLIVWKGADGWEHQEVGVELNLEEGPDPLQFTLEDWIDQERE
jgi:hypothetical protein